MRLDRFLARRFRTWTRTTFSRCIRQGLVQDEDGRALRADPPPPSLCEAISERPPPRGSIRFQKIASSAARSRI